MQGGINTVLDFGAKMFLKDLFSYILDATCQKNAPRPAPRVA